MCITCGLNSQSISLLPVLSHDQDIQALVEIDSGRHCTAGSSTLPKSRA